MIRALIDTNMILDYFEDRAPYAEQAERIFDLIGHNRLTGILTASAVTDIYYIMRKTIGREKSLENLKLLFSVFEIASVGKIDLLRAVESSLEDFEDAVISVCAKRANAAYIITRNIGVFAASTVPPITPQDFLLRFFE